MSKYKVIHHNPKFTGILSG